MIRLALRVRRADAELVLAELLELVPNGVEEVDIDADTLEYAVYGAPGELPELPDLRAAAAGALVELSSREVADDWADRWREFHRPLILGDRLCVRPPWEPPAPGVALDIVIDPGRAFGTGAHPTTRLCLELLLQASPVLEVSPARGLIPRPRGGRGIRGSRRSRTQGEANTGGIGEPEDADRRRSSGFIRHAGSWNQPSYQAGELPGFAAVDLGCGSGVLAIAAARLGYSPVLALDYDPLSVAATVENAAVNGVALEVRRFDLRTEPVPAAPLVLANLLAPLLRDWCAQLAADPAARPLTVIASGLLATEADVSAAEFAAAGLSETDRRIDGEWAALVLRSKVG